MSDSEEDAYGPSLPPGMRSSSQKEGNGGSRSASSSDEGGDLDMYLPALPPHMKKSDKERESNNSKSEKDIQSSLQNVQKEPTKRTGVSLYNQPKSKALKRSPDEEKCVRKSDGSDSDDVYGPALSPHLIAQRKEKTTLLETKASSESDDEDMYGPALPPHLLHRKTGSTPAIDSKRVVGPTLPKGFIPPEEPSHITSKGDSSESEDEGPVIGPSLPTEKVNEKEYRARQLELRAQKMKDKLEGKDEPSDKPLVRESWMTELPDDKPNFCGLSARQFSRRTPQEKGDRSVWTDTPADRARKSAMTVREEEELTPELIASRQRDEELAEKVESYNKAKRAKPLIEIHQKKKKEREAASGPKERKPFSREEDLNVNRFDEAQKKNILKKARQLDDRFSSGKRKFL